MNTAQLIENLIATVFGGRLFGGLPESAFGICRALHAREWVSLNLSRTTDPVIRNRQSRTLSGRVWEPLHSFSKGGPRPGFTLSSRYSLNVSNVAMKVSMVSSLIPSPSLRVLAMIGLGSRSLALVTSRITLLGASI